MHGAAKGPDSNRDATWVSLLVLFIGLLVLNALLTVFLWYPEYEFTRLLSPSAETAVLFIFLLLLTLARPRRNRWLFLPVSVLILVYILYGMGEALKQHVYRRPFVPWTDLEFIPPLLNMIFRTGAFGKGIVLVVGGGLIVILSMALIYLLIRGLERRIRLVGPWYSGGIALLFTAAGIVVGFGKPLTLVMAGQIRPPIESNLSSSITPATIGDAAKSSVNPGDAALTVLPWLGGRNLYLFIIESYGETLYANPLHFELMNSTFIEVESELNDAGFTVLSQFLRSPTFGGTSWLADATLLTGVVVDTQQKYNEVFRSDIENMTHLLNRAGYYTIMSAPGTRLAYDEWKRFYTFDEYYFLTDFGYQGPFFTFGVMPDQYQINEIRRKVLSRKRDVPVFTEFILVSSHTPFSRVPPYIDDWESIGDGSEYHTLPSETFRNNWLTGGEYPEGYTSSVRYVLNVVSRFLIEFVDDSAVIIITGDHQPKFPVSEKGASFSVPMHILSRDADVIEPFRHYGFSESFQPRNPEPHPGLEIFFPVFRDIATGKHRDKMLLEQMMK